MKRSVAATAIAVLLACNEPSRPVAPHLLNDSAAAGALVLPAPSNVTATPTSSTQITVSWRDNSVGSTRIEVHRSPTGAPGTFALIATVNDSPTTYNDGGLTRATQYCYQVRAVRPRGSNPAYSAFSNTACATTGPGASFTVIPDSAYVVVTGYTWFRAEYRDDLGNLVSPPGPITWTTSDPAVATISSTGQAIGLTRGRAIITATSGGMTDVANFAVLSPVLITTSTTGVDIDAYGYFVCWDGGCSSQQVASNGAVSYGMGAGDHLVSLSAVAANCSVTGEYPRRINVNPDADAVVAFDIVCSPRETLAAVYWNYCDYWTCGYDDYIPYIALGYTNDVWPAILGPEGTEPSWSPDARFIAFTSSAGEIAVVNVGTGAVTTLTQDPASDWSPDWSPDGSRIAFASSRGGQAELYVMSANGSNPVRLTNGVGFQGSPAWSPNGSRIAFDCMIDSGNLDICAINADGSGFARLTSDPGPDAHPAWSPDGQRIAFDTRRYVAVFAPEIVMMNADGTGVTRLAPGVSGESPAWSPDGTRIAASDGYFSTIVIIRVDGTTAAANVFWNATDPVWKPRTP